MVGGDRRHLLQPGDPLQNPLGQIGVQPHALELGHGQTARLGPDLVGHPDAADVVELGRSAGQRDRIGSQADGDRGVGRELRGRPRMTQCERAFEVDEVTRGRSHRAALPTWRCPRPSEAGWHRRPHRCWPSQLYQKHIRRARAPCSEVAVNSAGSQYIHFASNARLVQSRVVESGPVSYRQPS
jgi:hypothetical protein